MRSFSPKLLPKLLMLLIMLLAFAVFIFGCQAQQKPAPPAEQTKLIPSESNIGFTEVDENQIPASVKKIVASMSDRQEAAWAAVGDNNYIILNPEDDDEPVKINEIIQRVPSQNFIWLDVKLVENDQENGQKDDGQKDEDEKAKLRVYKLAKTDNAVNGVGFEFKETDDEKEKSEAENQNQPAQAPKTTRPVTPAPDRAPVQQVKPAPEKTQPAPAEQAPNGEQPEDEAPGDTDNRENNQ